MADRPRHARTIAGWTLATILAAAAVAGPALAEARVNRQLRDRLGANEHFAVGVDLGGLELRGLSRELPDARGQVRIARLRIRPHLRGLAIEIEGLEGLISKRSATPPAPATEPGAAKPPPATPARATTPAKDPIATLLLELRGFPITITTQGRVVIELAEGLTSTAIDPQFELPGDGRLLGRGQFELGAGAGAPSWARAVLEFAAADERPRELRLQGSVELDDSASDPSTSERSTNELELRGQVSPGHAALELRELEGGSATLKLERGFEPGRDRLTLDALALPLALLEPLARLSGDRLADALGEREGRVIVDEARITGHVELVRGSGLTRARLEAVELTQLTVTSELLAPKPIFIAALQLDGELAREHTPTGPRSFGNLVLGHAGVTLQLAAQLDHAGFDLNLELPTTPCQALIGALPGAPAVLAGTELRGELDAHFALHLDFAALDQARKRHLGDEPEPLDLRAFVAPGELRFSLPYLERCAVVRLGPGVDLQALAGPYRHRFETGSGQVKRRVLAPGDQSYVPLASVPQLARAFVILEDSRYWEHDGFDREQIERAFWFNILEGRISRGASTISQQATRSLWLGIDRSIARKLSEAMLTAELERGLDKRRILEIYLNIIELGPEIHGVAEAARYHFGKQARDLTLIEALHLASMAPAPVGYARRFASGELDSEWRAHLLRQVRRLQIRRLITAEQAQEAAVLRLALRPHPELLERDTAANRLERPLRAAP